MKYGKVLRVLVVILLIFSVMPVVPFAVHAADPKTETIIGWRQSAREEGITEIGVDRVLINGEELPQDGASVTMRPGEDVTVDVYFKKGYALSNFIEAGIILSEPEEYERKPDFPVNFSNAWDKFSAHTFFRMSSEQFFQDGVELYVVVPVRKMTEEDLAYLIDSVDLTIKAPEAGTVITAEFFSDSEYYDYDTQNPYPDVTIPTDVNYFLYDADGELYGYYFEPEVPSPFDRDELKFYVSNDEHPELKDGDKLLAEIWLVPEEEYYFSDIIDVKVNGGEYVTSYLDYEYTDGDLVVYIMVTIGGEPVPDTGDVSTVWLWTVISAVSAVALAGVLVYRKKLH